MLISDLNHFEDLGELSEMELVAIEGSGYANAFAQAFGDAYGQATAETRTRTFTFVNAQTEYKQANAGSESIGYANV